jgi:hypothetical protein
VGEGRHGKRKVGVRGHVQLPVSGWLHASLLGRLGFSEFLNGVFASSLCLCVSAVSDALDEFLYRFSPQEAVSVN